jgi:CarD family transcriptional regulator
VAVLATEEEENVASRVVPEIGEVLIFGAEGFARVEGVGEREVLGKTTTFLDLFVIDANMRVSVPIERALERGLRSISSSDEMDVALENLSASRWRSIPWNRDGRLVKDRYAEGDLEATVDVTGSLIEVAQVKRLNDAQRTLFERARRALVLETASAFGIEEDEASDRVADALGGRVPL